MGLQLKGGTGGGAANRQQKNKNTAFGAGEIQETPEMRELRMKREADAAAAKAAIAQKQEEMRQKALVYEQMEAAKKQREDLLREEEELRNNPALAAERARRLAAEKEAEEQRARFKAEEEAKIEAERRVQEKKMNQTDALIAAIRAQVEKEKAEKEAATQKQPGAMSSSKPASGEPKPTFRTISPEEMAKLKEKKRLKAAGINPNPVQPKEEKPVVEAPKPETKMNDSVGISGGLGGLSDGPTLSNLSGNGPTLSNMNAGQESLTSSGMQGGGLGIDITSSVNVAQTTSKADESTVALNVDEINAAMEKSKEPVGLKMATPEPTPQPVQPQPTTIPPISVQSTPAKPQAVVPEPVQVIGGASTIIVDDSSAWGGSVSATETPEEEVVSWVGTGATPTQVHAKDPSTEVKNEALVDDNGDIISVVPVRQRPMEKNDVQSAYNIDFDDDDDDDDVMSFGTSSNEEAKRQAEEEARRKAEEEAKRQAEEEARRKAEEEARRQAEEEARRKAEEEAKRQAEEEARRKAEEEARRQAEEEARRKAEEEAKRKAEEEARRQAEEEARRKAEEEARRKAEEEAKRQAEEEARRKAEEEARRKAEEEAKRRAEEEARRKAEEEAKRQAEEEARRKAEEEAKRQAEEEARRKAEEEAKRQAEEEARRKAEEEARRQAEEEARRKAEEEAKRQAEEEARRKAEEEARRQAEEEARRKAEEEARRQAEEEAKRKAEEEARRQAEEEARRQAEEEAKRKAEEAAKAAAAASSYGYSLPVGAEQFLGKYLSVNAINDQIANTMKYISENPNEPRNIVILGQYGFGTTTIAEDFARSFYAMGLCKTKTIAKIKAGALNRANISDAIGKLQGGCLVIENAGVITNEKLDEVYQIVNDPSNDVVVIMTGQIETLSRIFKDNVVISTQFKHLIQVNRITDMDVFTIAKNHATQLGYPCETSAENNLRRRMQEVESGNLDRVLKIVDNAVSKAHNREITSGDQDHRLVPADFE